MKIIEARGTHRAMGRAVGEGLREEIHGHIEEFMRRTAEESAPAVATMRRVLQGAIPQVLEQFEGMAEGAGVDTDRLLALNLPEGSPVHMIDTQACSNAVFADGPDGPVWGKNNDGGPPPEHNPEARSGQRPRAALKLYPDDGIPSICVTFCGWLSGGDMMNAEGLAAGHSSVGSRFEQSPLHVPVLQWLYWIMFRSKSTADYQKNLTMLPLYGKGFTQAVVDRHGVMCSPEIACPLVQIRRPEQGERAMHCVNHYQQPQLEGIDRRSPEGLANSKARSTLLADLSGAGDRSIEHMKQILSHHGTPSICRHGDEDLSWTEYSMIGACGRAAMLVADGAPCTHDYVEISL